MLSGGAVSGDLSGREIYLLMTDNWLESRTKLPLSKLSMPALLITGEKDTKYTNIAQRMQAVLPHAFHFSVSNASHMPHLEQSDPVKMAIHTFLADL